MPGRERFLVHVICPQCEQRGVVIWERSEDPVYQQGEWHTTLTRTSEGFRPGVKGQIVCANCAIEAAISSKRTEI